MTRFEFRLMYRYVRQNRDAKFLHDDKALVARGRCVRLRDIGLVRCVHAIHLATAAGDRAKGWAAGTHDALRLARGMRGPDSPLLAARTFA